jgi:hypothetical protein
MDTYESPGDESPQAVNSCQGPLAEGSGKSFRISCPDPRDPVCSVKITRECGAFLVETPEGSGFVIAAG